MGITCDNCKLRKVKCDRVDRIKEQRQIYGENLPDEAVSCSNCIRHSLKCALTKTVSKARTGSRLRQLQRKEAEEQIAQPSDSTNPSFEPSSSAIASLPPSVPDTPNVSAPEHWSAIQRNQTSSADTTPGSLKSKALELNDFEMTHVRSTGLLQVAGLTRHILEACLHAYFKWSAPTSPTIRGRDFSVGYRAFFALYTGSETTDRPVSEGLILGLAAVGAGMLESDAAIGGVGKFVLQRRLLARFLEYLREYRWIERSDEESIDLLAACYSTSFLHIEEGENQAQEGSDPFTRTALSDEFLASLVFKLKLNRAPKLETRAPEDGPRWRTGRGEKLLDDWEAIYRKKLFLSVYYNDGFRAMGTQTHFKIPNDSHDHHMSLYRHPRYDPGFCPYGPLPAEISPHGETQPSFERQYLLAVGSLSSLTRQHAGTFTSTRSQGLGIPVKASMDAFDAWEAWYSSMSDELRVWRRMPVDWNRGSLALPEGYDLFKLIRCVFLDMLYSGTISGAVKSLEDFGFLPDHSTGDTDELLRQKRALCCDTLRRVAKLSRVAGTIGLLRCSPVVCRNQCAGFVLWACDLVMRRSDPEQRNAGGSEGMSREEALSCIDELLYGISTVDSAQGTPVMHAALLEHRNKIGMDSLKQLHIVPDTTPSTVRLPSSDVAELTAGMPANSSNGLLECLETDTLPSSQPLWAAQGYPDAANPSLQATATIPATLQSPFGLSECSGNGNRADDELLDYLLRQNF
ncbi:unnamed protein product [Sympodiomycopsis kandeliae]